MLSEVSRSEQVAHIYGRNFPEDGNPRAMGHMLIRHLSGKEEKLGYVHGVTITETEENPELYELEKQQYLSPLLLFEKSDVLLLCTIRLIAYSDLWSRHTYPTSETKQNVANEIPDIFELDTLDTISARGVLLTVTFNPTTLHVPTLDRLTWSKELREEYAHFQQIRLDQLRKVISSKQS
ncbi:MAG: hypothetical protein WDZ94_04730 [Patescibacteria group bacterium]